MTSPGTCGRREIDLMNASPSVSMREKVWGGDGNCSTSVAPKLSSVPLATAMLDPPQTRSLYQLSLAAVERLPHQSLLRSGGHSVRLGRNPGPAGPVQLP